MTNWNRFAITWLRNALLQIWYNYFSLRYFFVWRLYRIVFTKDSASSLVVNSVCLCWFENVSLNFFDDIRLFLLQFDVLSVQIVLFVVFFPLSNLSRWVNEYNMALLWPCIFLVEYRFCSFPHLSSNLIFEQKSINFLELFFYYIFIERSQWTSLELLASFGLYSFLSYSFI